VVAWTFEIYCIWIVHAIEVVVVWSGVGVLENLLEFVIEVVGAKVLYEDYLDEALSPHPQFSVVLTIFSGGFQV